LRSRGAIGNLPPGIIFRRTIWAWLRRKIWRRKLWFGVFRKKIPDSRWAWKLRRVLRGGPLILRLQQSRTEVLFPRWFN